MASIKKLREERDDLKLLYGKARSKSKQKALLRAIQGLNLKIGRIKKSNERARAETQETISEKLEPVIEVTTSITETEDTSMIDKITNEILSIYEGINPKDISSILGKYVPTKDVKLESVVVKKVKETRKKRPREGKCYTLYYILAHPPSSVKNLKAWERTALNHSFDDAKAIDTVDLKALMAHYRNYLKKAGLENESDLFVVGDFDPKVKLPGMKDLSKEIKEAKSLERDISKFSKKKFNLIQCFSLRKGEETRKGLMKQIIAINSSIAKLEEKLSGYTKTVELHKKAYLDTLQNEMKKLA